VDEYPDPGARIGDLVGPEIPDELLVGDRGASRQRQPDQERPFQRPG
jgi:hypothetical protein